MKAVWFLLLIGFSAVWANDNLPFGEPIASNPALTVNQVVDRAGYALGYANKYEQAAWVAYKLTAREATSQKVKRESSKFAVDAAIDSGSATAADYEKSGYDRGHLAPAADMHWSQKAMDQCFYYSNMSPQKPQFNRGIWKKLEAEVRQIAIDSDSIYVVTGPVLKGGLATIGPDHVAVPRNFYKVLLYVSPSDTMAIGFLLPNKGSSRPLRDFAVSVDAVEQATGLDFFSKLPDGTEDRIEAELDPDIWLP